MRRIRRLATNPSVVGSAIVILLLVLEGVLAVAKINTGGHASSGTGC